MPRQLTFDLPVREALGRDDFFVSDANALALAAVDAWRGWPGGKLVLAGPKGAGKSHLAHVWAAEAGARIVAAADLPAADLPALAAAPACVAVEDADRIAGQRTAEEALFHLHNLIAAAGGRLLLSARAAPSRWGLALPDLASRMQAAGVATLAPPDDALLTAVLAKLFADRQLAVPDNLAPYLARRLERSFAAARAAVAAIDARALAEGRPVTRALAAAALDLGGPDAQ